MTVPTSNGHGPTASGTITRTPSFAPITPVVKERVGDVAMRLSEVEKIIDDINLQSATSTTRSPTMGDLQLEIDMLKRDIEGTRAAQKKQIENLRNDVKNDVKENITKTMRIKIEKKITESVEAQVRVEVAEWGQSNETKRFVESLGKLVRDNDILHQEARIKLDNSRSRHENSTLDEHADFETNLSAIKLGDGGVSKVFPRTLKELFSYDEHQLLQLFDDYGLRRLNTHLENLNRFLAFIGLRFSVPEQRLDFLEGPPAYSSPNILEPLKEEKPQKTLPVSPPNQSEKKTEATPEVKPEHEKSPQEPATVNNNPVQVQTQEKQPDQQLAEEIHEPKQDHGGQRPAGIELSTLTRQSSTVANNQRPQQTNQWPQQTNQWLQQTNQWPQQTSQWPQQTNPAFPATTINRNPHTQPPPPNPQGGKGVGGWFKSITDSL